MTKVISINDYLNKKNDKISSPLQQTNPIWFSEICEGIKTIAFKDQELIYKNVKYNYYSQYINYVQLNGLIDNSYSFLNYINDHINLKSPFKIFHGVDFSGEYSINRLSDNDWINIADMIVRISLSYYLKKNSHDIKLHQLAQQYEWDYVIMDTK